jgi:T4 RnlA family RNA ligase
MLQKAMEIVESNDAFYYKDEIIEGNKFRIFNYRLASAKDFENPFACELRGLTINLENGEHFLSIHKFFNDKENVYTINDENWKNIKLEAREKLDGSLIMPVIINGKIYLKSKSTFKSEQAQMAMKILQNDKNLQNFIIECYNEGMQPLFELISPFNQIVIQYPKTQLKLIQIRANTGWMYLDYETLEKIAKTYNIPYCKAEYLTLDELRKRQKEYEGIEGWVVYNPNSMVVQDTFRKFKTDYYFRLHRLLTYENLAENKVIENILNETIDDVLSQLDANSEKRKYIEEIQNKLSHYFDRTLKELEILFNEKNKTDRKSFALKYKNHPYFGVIMQSKNKNDLEKNLKLTILKRTNKLEKAKNFLENIS